MLTTVQDSPPLQVPPDLCLGVRIACFVSHPIQYQSPLLRRIAAQPDIHLKVFFFSDLSMRSYQDPGFGVSVRWDIPLVDGYDHEFLPVYRDRGGLGFADPLCRGIYQRLRRGGFDAVWVHGYHTLNHLHALFAAKRLGLPVLLRTDSTLTDRPRSHAKLLVKRLFFDLIGSAVAGVLPVSEANAGYWRKHLPGVPQFSMPYAVDNDFFRSLAERAARERESFRAALRLEPGRPIILFASKLQKRKRCIDLVTAYFELCESNNLDAKPYLLIVGDGEERSAIEALIREAGSTDVRMLGFRNQTELPQFFDLCDVFVLPSVLEPYGLIVNEVMNAGRPVIVSDEVGCHRDLVENGINGIVFPAKNTHALADALHHVLQDPERAQSMGRASRERIEHFSFEQDIAGLRQAMASLVKNVGH